MRGKAKFSFEVFLDLLPIDGMQTGETFLLLTGGVGGISPVRLTSESRLLQSIFNATTGARRKISMSSGGASSSTWGDVIGGTTPTSVEGSGAEGSGGNDAVSLGGS